MFDTDLGREYSAAALLGVSARSLFEAGAAGALCDQVTRNQLQQLGDRCDWDLVDSLERRRGTD
jgi:aminodeoxyfutalosine deaminase